MGREVARVASERACRAAAYLMTLLVQAYPDARVDVTVGPCLCCGRFQTLQAAVALVNTRVIGLNYQWTLDRLESMMDDALDEEVRMICGMIRES